MSAASPVSWLLVKIANAILKLSGSITCSRNGSDLPPIGEDCDKIKEAVEVSHTLVEDDLL